MYKANRRDGLCERSLTMFPVGIDVSKNTLDLCMLYDGIKGRIKPVTSRITDIQLKIFFAGSGFNIAVRKMFMW
jgi:hypothetical protein